MIHRSFIAPIVLTMFLAVSQSALGADATVKLNALRQEIDGFGGSDCFRQAENLMKLAEPERTQVLDLLFSTTKGAGISIVRNCIGESVLTGEVTAWAGNNATIEPKEGQWNWTGDEGQIWLMKEAGKRGCTRFMSSAWSPPAWMKTNNNVINGGNLKKDKYRAYAEYLAEYVNGYKAHHGIEIYAVSPQNEPTFSGNYPCCQWSAQDFLELTKNHIIPVWKEKKVAAKYMLGEHMFWDESFAAPSLNDPEACARVDIVAAHGYGAPNGFGVLPVATAKKKRIWETEVYNNAANFPDGGNSIGNALYWAEYIHNHMTVSQANAWLCWWLIAQAKFEGTLISIDGGAGKLTAKSYLAYPRLFAVGNFSRFVRPGWMRVEATAQPAPGVLVSAYKDKTTGEFAVVAINKNNAPQGLSIALDGGAAAAVTPYRTSDKEKLRKLDEIKAADGKLPVTLAPKSVTTLVGKAR